MGDAIGERSGSGRPRPRRDAPRLIHASGQQGPAPLSFAQRRLWFLHQLAPESKAYNEIIGIRLEGRIDENALENSLDQIAQRHELLRTRFDLVADVPAQIVEVTTTLRPQRIDMSQVVEERFARAIAAARQHGLRPYDLRRGPLIRSLLIRLDADLHWLVLAMHHIVLDGWAFDRLMSELQALYVAYSGGQPDPLEPLGIQYADFARWQNDRWPKGPRHPGVAHWQRHLAGAPAALDLMCDFTRPRMPNDQGGRVAVHIPSILPALRSASGGRESSTPFVFLLAVYAILLGRYARQQDVVIGTPFTGRMSAQIEPLLGFFVNTLPLRFDLGGDPVFREFLQQVHRTCLAGFDHQEIPFESIVEALRPDRDLDRMPLFQVMFSFNIEDAFRPRRAGALMMTPFEIELETAKFDLWLNLNTRADDVFGFCEFSRDLFRQDTIERQMRCFATLAASAARLPERRISELPMVVEAERRALVERSLGTPPKPRSAEGIEELFEQQVRRVPGRIAVVGAARNWTYRELNELADRIAARLAHDGIGRGHRVAILMERSAELVGGILGALKAGATYVPLDPVLPRRRLERILSDAAPSVVLVSSRADAWANLHSGIPVQSLEDFDACQGGSVSRRDRSHPVYLTYTSGSQGEPKGVGLSHAALVNLIEWHNTRHLRESRTLMLASPSFDVSFYEIFAALSSGGTLVPAAEDVRGDPASLIEYLKLHRIEKVIVPVPILNQIAERLALRPGTLRDLKECISTGEPLRITTAIRRFFRDRPGTSLHNHYGPSETHVVTAYALSGDPDTWPESPPIGLAIPGAQLFLLDAAGAPTADGEPGEICIGGVAVPEGYWNREELTRDRFINWKGLEGRTLRLYRTGDLAVRRGSGELHYLGRLDDQVKIRGVRVEPAETEAILERHSAVRACVVVPVRDQDRGNRLVAYYVPVDGSAPPAVSALREFAREQVPDAMIPTSFIALDEFPVTLSGKIDRSRLQERARTERPINAISSGHAEYAPPRTVVQGTLCELWSSLLAVDRVGLDDDFFDLGGESLSAARLTARIESELGIRLPIREVFDHPTIRQLASRCEAYQQPAQVSRTLAGRVDPRPPRIPLSFAQKRLWFLDRLDPYNPTYNISLTFDCTGSLDLRVLEHSLQWITRRHETLRTSFEAVEGEPAQVVAHDPCVNLRLVDLAGLPEPERETRARDVAAAEAVRPFDLSHAPLLRTLVVRHAPDRILMQFTLHHIVADGASLAVFLRELALGYRAGSLGTDTLLAPLPMQYADHSLREREHSNTPSHRNQIEYWRRALAGAPPLYLEADCPRPVPPSVRGGRESARMDAAVVRSLETLARQESSTVFHVLLAGFQILLSRYSTYTDISVGVPLAQRDSSELEPMIGLLVTTQVIRTDLSDNPTFRAVIRKVRERFFEAHENREVPFERIVAELRPSRDPSRTPLFQAMANLIDLSKVALDLPGLRATLLDPNPILAKFDLELYIRRDMAGIQLDLVYAADLFETGRMAALLGQLRAYLERAAVAPDDPAVTLPSGPQSGSGGSPDPPLSSPPQWLGPVHAQISRSAASAATRPAITGSHGTWTYEQLERRANKIAHALAPHVGIGDIVAVEGLRSATLVGALLGVWKAGAAFVILDPADPPRRSARRWRVVRPKVYVSFRNSDSGPPEPIPTFPCQELGDVPQPVRLELPLDPNALDDLLYVHTSDFAAAHQQPGDLAYVVFTSGTTGEPRGVAVTHGAISYFPDWYRHGFQLDRIRRFGMISGVAYDPFLRDFLAPLSGGAHLFVPDPDDLNSAQRLFLWCRTNLVEWLHLTPVWCRLLGNIAASQGPLESLRGLVVGGDRLDSNDVIVLRRLAPNAEIVNAYGASETPQIAAFFRVPSGDDPELRTAFTSHPVAVPIGNAIPGNRLLVVRDGRTCAPGEVGEIHIISPYLARGYFEETSGSTLELRPLVDSGDPFTYRSGDMGYVLSNGSVRLLGRRDRQTKIHGHRVELGGIEAAVRGVDGIVDAAALLVHPDGKSEDPRLVVYFSASSEISTFQLRRQLAAELPIHEIPIQLVGIDALPRSSNAKVDWKALASFPQVQATRVALTPIRTDTERVIADIWKEVLGIDEVGADENFFDLGGNSMQALVAYDRIERVLGTRLHLRDFFLQSLAQLATSTHRDRDQAGASHS